MKTKITYPHNKESAIFISRVGKQACTVTPMGLLRIIKIYSNYSLTEKEDKFRYDLIIENFSLFFFHGLS